MATNKGLWASMRSFLRGESTHAPEVAPQRLRPQPGAVASDQQTTTLPMSLTEMVRVSRANISADLREAIEAGQSRVTIGIGDVCDIQLLDDDLLAADVRLSQRRLVVLTVLFNAARGFSVSRGQANFGVFIDGDGDNDDYGQLHRYRQIDDLLPNDRVGLGSCPADAVWFKLPSIRGVRFAAHSARTTPMGGFKLRYQAQFRAALLHWRYSEITFGSDDAQLIWTNEPELMGLKGSLFRTPDDPAQGYRIRLHNGSVPVFLSRGGYGVFNPVPVGVDVAISGLGNRLRMGDEHQVELPPPTLVTGRFTGRDLPTADDIIAVFGLHPDNLAEYALVKSRYRQLVRALHPDRAGDNEGHVSRFIEVQACWQAYQQTYGPS